MASATCWRRTRRTTRYYGNGTFGARTKVFSNRGSSYNVIVGAGDITGDGKADLVSRDSAGNVWRNNGDGEGSFGARTRIATGWQGYKGLFKDRLRKRIFPRTGMTRG
ncbi:FG-GAP repeat domain-containing protein [Streptomyces sp. NPDC001668]|uniref:FG-GAP repeat domain-containing protein n=1 Tax=unclassified Streptomyces TaxID=2593676 RepID=UPI0036BD782D